MNSCADVCSLRLSWAQLGLVSALCLEAKLVKVRV